MTWGRPDLLALLWAAPPLAALLWGLTRRQFRALERITHPEMVARLAGPISPARVRWRLALWLSAYLLLAVSLARPQWGEHLEDVRRRGLDIVVALDTSRSMLADDLKPNRLQQAKWGIRDLVNQLQGDRVGLVSFAGSAFLQCPLTIDYAAFMMTLDDVYAGIIPVGGTAIAEALRVAGKAFDRNTASDKVIILITDGENHEGDPAGIVDELRKDGIRVFAIGVGSVEGALIPLTGADGSIGFVKDHHNNTVKTALREDLLEALALGTGGVYVRAVPGNFGTDQVVREGLQNLKRDESEARIQRTRKDQFGWFVGGALACLAVEAMVGPRPRRSPEEGG